MSRRHKSSKKCCTWPQYFFSRFWGCAKSSYTRALHAIQSVKQRLITGAPWYLINPSLLKDSHLHTARELAIKCNKKNCITNKCYFH